ncbi:shikimate 5-dehydrogenase [Capnocytophaga cynodegmi]|uniref:shikimate dehydrogenase family protein n=1 Tax=Capnocytophaga cynodegmi TaxID=28189 RepID=UPI001AC52800|nr:shikimate dehydrogenase [Capnocytophaga cynodegmi]GIM52105.1 shikimate 5-dehydrogenase [Capnocytophaga cynodegmi]
MKRLFALVGKNISYSFSRTYFTEKFEKEHISDAEYVNFDLNSVDELPQKLQKNPNIQGMNVTIPYKKEIIPMLAKLDPIAEEIGAVNTIKITQEGLIGYNTDYFGFSESLKPFLKEHHTKALILGTGGASNAVAYALKMLGISFRFVSRTPKMGQFSYSDLSSQIINKYKIIINCTPLGTFPNVEDFPPIPYQFLTSEHLLYDLIYNPERTTFLQKGEKKKAIIINGLKMLELQAEKAWEIWNEISNESKK